MLSTSDVPSRTRPSTTGLRTTKARAPSLEDVLAGRRRGRGAVSNPTGRFEREVREADRDRGIADPEPGPDRDRGHGREDRKA